MDHPLMDKIEQLEEQLKRENKFRRKENKAAALLSEKQAARIAELEVLLSFLLSLFALLVQEYKY